MIYVKLLNNIYNIKIYNYLREFTKCIINLIFKLA